MGLKTEYMLYIQRIIREAKQSLIFCFMYMWVDMGVKTIKLIS